MAMLVAVYLFLLLLLGLSVVLSAAGLGATAIPAHLALAGVMALAIYWHFMHLKASSGLVRAFAFGVALWLAFLFVFTASDYLARGDLTANTGAGAISQNALCDRSGACADGAAVDQTLIEHGTHEQVPVVVGADAAAR